MVRREGDFMGGGGEQTEMEMKVKRKVGMETFMMVATMTKTRTLD